MNTLRLFALIAAVAFSIGCRTLEVPGEYNGDKVLFQAETTIVTSYELVDSFTKWEFENRELLKPWPEINGYANYLRQNYPGWHATANALRDAYKLNRDDATKSELQRTLALLREALLQASAHMAKATQ